LTGEWGADRVDDLVALTSAALPHERLSSAELAACLWDDPGPAVVLGDRRGAVAAVVRGTVGHLRLLVVAPEARRRGAGRELLRAAEEWMVGRGATELRVGAEVPYYLWPGVPIEATAALALLETSGYDDAGAVLDMICPTDLVAPPPAGVEVRLVDGGTTAAVAALVDREWPWWRDEVDRAVDQGGCVGAFTGDGAAVGFGCHSVSRAGWIGPIGTDPAAGRGGVGAAVMAGLCAELRVRGHAEAEICWVGPIAFYAKACGARMSRAFQTRVKKLP
jgi:GNAT superfamily N-acetyltransferase